MQVPPLHPRSIDPSSLPLEALASNHQIPEAQKVAQASRAFEAVLLRQILAESERPAFPSKFLNDSCTNSIYRDMVVKQLADDIAKSGSFGLAQSLSKQLQKQTASPKPPGPAGVPTDE